jgi:hypothetical protein
LPAGTLMGWIIYRYKTQMLFSSQMQEDHTENAFVSGLKILQ